MRTRIRGWRRRVRTRREAIRHKPTLNTTYRIALGTFGAVVVLAGLAMVPYPGPGWLVVFAGLGLLATEFHWAHRVNTFAKRQYHRWVRWLQRQHFATKLVVMGTTGAIVLLTMWLLGMFALVGDWLNLNWMWLASPLLDA